MQGHSWGGFEVNYIATRTSLFAAAVDAAGPSDFIVAYNSLSHGDLTRTFFYESSQSRIGHSLWQRPDLYIKNSPVYHADQVTTPILIMHNKNDQQVPWVEGLEWFNALRRNGKQAWWLQYKNGGHGVNGHDATDYTMRMTQFFDHFLKDEPEPEWMRKSGPESEIDR